MPAFFSNSKLNSFFFFFTKVTDAVDLEDGEIACRLKSFYKTHRFQPKRRNIFNGLLHPAFSSFCSFTHSRQARTCKDPSSSSFVLIGCFRQIATLKKPASQKGSGAQKPRCNTRFSKHEIGHLQKCALPCTRSYNYASSPLLGRAPWTCIEHECFVSLR